MEQACRQKKQQNEKQEGAENKFFHGAEAAVADLSICDSHHRSNKKRSDSDIRGEGMLGEIVTLEITQSEAMAASSGMPTSSVFLGDTGASHHICNTRSSFTMLTPVPGPFKIRQVQGTVDITHWGTIRLQVDSSTGPRLLTLYNVLLVESMCFNILSIQKLRTVNYIPVFAEMPGKCIVKKRLPNGHLEQIALMTETRGRLTKQFHHPWISC